MKHKLLNIVLACILGAAAVSASVYNVFLPGGALSGTWNSQNVNVGAGAPYITGTLPVGNISGLGSLATQNGTFSGTSSGTNTGDQTITLTGDCTGAGTGSFATTCTKTSGVSFAASATTDTTNASNIGSGTLGAAQLPNPTASTLGGVESLASASHKWINTISTSGVPAATQPACADLSDSAASCATDATNAANLGSGTLPAGRLPALTGDVTTSVGTAATTVGKINGTALSGLATGLLINTTTTGVPSAYGGTTCTNQFPRSLSASGAATCASVNLANDISSTLSVSHGGTGVGTLSGIPFGNGTGNFTVASATSILSALIGGTKFTTSGCSISATTGGAASGTFTLGANSCTAVLTINGATGLTATTGWTCEAHDRTAPTVLIGGESSSTTTTASIAIPAGAGATDVISFSCRGY